MDDASLSGTVIEMWMSPQALEQCLPANESISGAGCAAGSQFNSNLYYELIDPLAPLALTGTLWCESEISLAASYMLVFTAASEHHLYDTWPCSHVIRRPRRIKRSTKR